MPVPHLGYVLKGKVTFTFADGSEEVYETGEAYHAPPGHTPTLYAGTEMSSSAPPSRCSRPSRS
ncbi:MAG TPA: cupin domain-containing protein [Miltoncostaeaceae bacterium]|nr:cupin domain-containing protein [Miltoncostaeaceae bacterium]